MDGSYFGAENMARMKTLLQEITDMQSGIEPVDEMFGRKNKKVTIDDAMEKKLETLLHYIKKNTERAEDNLKHQNVQGFKDAMEAIAEYEDKVYQVLKGDM